MTLASSKKFNLSLGAQDAWGTAASGFGEDLSYPGSYSVKVQKPNQGSYPVIGSAANAQFHEGITSLAGSISGALAPDCPSTQFLLASLFASNTVTGTTEFTHVFSGDIQVPSYGLTANYTPGGSSNNLTKNDIGLFLSTFSISKDETGGPITFSTDMIGVKSTAHGQTRTAATPAVVPYYNSKKAKLEIKTGANDFSGMTTVEATTFSFSITTGVELRNGSGSNPVAVAQGKPVVTLSFSQDLSDSATQTIYDFFSNATTVSAQITLEHDSEASAGNTYETKIQLPSCVFQGDGYEVSEGSVIPETYTLNCLEHSTLKQAKITVLDSTSGTFTV